MKELERFLKSLQEVKNLKDREGTSYSCFGAYDGDNETCAEESGSICRVCKLMCTEASDDWIDTALGIVQGTIKP